MDPKHDEIMDYTQNMVMHATICHELNSKSNNSNMHAWIMLYINMYELKHGLALQFNMDHARISSNTRMRRWNPYLSLVFKVWELKYAIYTSITNLIFKNKSSLSLSLPQGRQEQEEGWGKSLFQVYTRLTLYIEIVATRGSFVNKANLSNRSIFNLI